MSRLHASNDFVNAAMGRVMMLKYVPLRRISRGKSSPGMIRGPDDYMTVKLKVKSSWLRSG
jgi:hypothetical protein